MKHPKGASDYLSFLKLKAAPFCEVLSGQQIEIELKEEIMQIHPSIAEKIVPISFLTVSEIFEGKCVGKRKDNGARTKSQHVLLEIGISMRFAHCYVVRTLSLIPNRQLLSQ